MQTISELKRNLQKDSSHLPLINVALLGDSATQLLALALQGTAIARGYRLNLFEADYNQIERQILVPDSEFHGFGAKYNIIFQSTHKLLNVYNKYKLAERENLADDRIAFVRQICAECHETILYCNYPEIDDAVFGNLANKIRRSFIFQLRKLNYELMRLAENVQNLFICDLSSVMTKCGRVSFCDSSFYVNGDMVISAEGLPHAAARIMDIICTFEGSIKKCVIIDLDNTIWGGNIGDVGIEGIQIGQGLGIGRVFAEFQQWLKKLKERGIILAICSKNEEELAKEPFLKHPDMILRLDDIAVFIANWKNKAENIHRIQSIINIGYDSMVFLDDNPVERSIVRENIPDIFIPELPDDPSDYLEYLYELNLFETTVLSNEDKQRTKMCQEEYARAKTLEKYPNESEFLSGLEMKASVKCFEKYDLPRIAELAQRSNQFNFRTIRYNEADLYNISKDCNYHTFAFTLNDKYGDYGIISFIVLKKIDNDALFIDNWVMSCRVFKRSMESFAMNQIVSYACYNGFKGIVGEFIPTSKNRIAARHYSECGFTEVENGNGNSERFYLDVKHYRKRECYIKEHSNAALY
jgi:FkbH-like protein